MIFLLIVKGLNVMRLEIKPTHFQPFFSYLLNDDPWEKLAFCLGLFALSNVVADNRKTLGCGEGVYFKPFS